MLAMAQLIAKNTHKNKFISTRAMREVKDDFKPILNALLELNIIVKLKEATLCSAASFDLNPIYQGTHTASFSKSEYDIIIGAFKKQTKRGKKATTDKQISFDISYNTFRKIMLQKYYNTKTPDIVDHTIETQWNLISDINRTGSINPSQRRDRRLYSTFTSLTKLVHPYMRIDGEKVVEIDQHACFWTLMPAFLRNNLRLVNQNYIYETLDAIDSLQEFINSSPNIYEAIADETSLSKEEVKKLSLSFICDPSKYMNDKKTILQNWFRDRFNFASDFFENIRKSNYVSYQLQSIEQDIFVRTAKELKIYGIDAVTKHDCILVVEKYKENAIAVLERVMKDKGVASKLKIDPLTEIPPLLNGKEEKRQGTDKLFDRISVEPVRFNLISGYKNLYPFISSTFSGLEYLGFGKELITRSGNLYLNDELVGFHQESNENDRSYYARIAQKLA
jgi:hypothetical protein